jgi:hypothetical protein
MSKIRKIEGSKAEDYETELDSLFSNSEDVDSIKVNLPSKGKFYNNFQEVSIKPLTYEEEDHILRSGGKGLGVINMLIEKCVAGIDHSDLLSMDKMYLLLKVREASYGEDYEFSIGCPDCHTEVKTSIKLTEDLRTNEVPDDLEDPRTFTLPRLGVEATVRFPRSREDGFLIDTPTTIKNLYRFVITLNGNSDPVFISKAIKRMHVIDVKKLLKEIHKGEFGLDSRFMFECPSCKSTTLMEMPLDAGFFSVT